MKKTEVPGQRVSKKSPTGPTERTPKPEYLIALATYLGGPLVRSHSIFDGEFHPVWSFIFITIYIGIVISRNKFKDPSSVGIPIYRGASSSASASLKMSCPKNRPVGPTKDSLVKIA